MSCVTKLWWQLTVQGLAGDRGIFRLQQGREEVLIVETGVGGHRLKDGPFNVAYHAGHSCSDVSFSAPPRSPLTFFLSGL